MKSSYLFPFYLLLLRSTMIIVFNHNNRIFIWPWIWCRCGSYKLQTKLQISTFPLPLNNMLLIHFFILIFMFYVVAFNVARIFFFFAEKVLWKKNIPSLLDFFRNKKNHLMFIRNSIAFTPQVSEQFCFLSKLNFHFQMVNVKRR